MKKRLLFLVAGILLVASFVFTTCLAVFFLGYKDLERAKSHFLEGQVPKAEARARDAEKKIGFSQSLLPLFSPIATFWNNKEFASFSSFLNTSRNISLGVVSLANGTNILKGEMEAVIGGREYDRKRLQEIELYLEESQKFLALAKSELSSVEKDSILARNYNVSNIERELDRVIKTVQLVGPFVSAIPGIVSMEEKKYAVLFQNNTELRPTGGFIGSFGILSLQNGTKPTITMYDVYDADGQLKGHVEPPTPIRKYLGQVNWFLRDSNWDPNFQKSAEKAAWFLEKEMNVRIDGVISLDTQVLKMILEHTGPIYLPDYEETITAENVILKTQYYTQTGFFPGSTQKKNFLSSLTFAIGEKVGSNTFDLSLFSILHKAASEKHMLFSFSEPNLQSVIEAKGWQGNLVRRNVLGEKTSRINDFLAIREANLGVNKANLYLQRQISHEVSFQEEGILEVLTITFDNQSKKEDKLEGMYKNYLRLYLPKEASITGISIDGQVQDTISSEINPLVYEKKDFSQKISGRLEIEQEVLGDISILGFLVEIPKETRKSVTVSYHLPAPFPLDRETTYHLSVSKQPGTNADPYVFAANYPPSYLLQSDLQSSFLEKERLTIPSDLRVDREFNLRITAR